MKQGLACLRKVGDAKHKADGVQDIGLATAIEPRDGIEEWVKVWDIYARCIGLEALEGDLLYIHPAFLCANEWASSLPCYARCLKRISYQFNDAAIYDCHLFASRASYVTRLRDYTTRCQSSPYTAVCGRAGIGQNRLFDT